jgi:hypothetical protein
MNADYRIVSYPSSATLHLKPTNEDRPLCEVERSAVPGRVEAPIPGWYTYPPGTVILLAAQPKSPLCQSCVEVFEMREDLFYSSELLLDQNFEFGGPS